MHGTFLLARAEIYRLRRNRRYLITTLAIPIVLYLLVGTRAKSTVYGVDFAAYYMVAMATFGSFSGALMNNSVRIAQERKEGWIRQLRLTSLPPNAYVIAKLMAAMAIAVAIGYRFQPDQVQPIAMLIYFVFIILGGVFFPLGGLIQKIGEFTPTYEAVKISTDLVGGASVPAGLVAGMVVWLAIFIGFATLSVRATAETV